MDASGAADLPVFAIVTGLLGGLALFLFGLETLSRALRTVAGDSMRKVLATLTTNRFVGAFTGALVTAVIQSSSVTTVLVVGFISAGIMTLGQAIGVIMGANIGSTMTAQLVAFKITEAALPLVTAGFAIGFLARNEVVKQWGAVLLGLGFVFLGMAMMSDAMAPLRQSPEFVEAVATLREPVWGVLVGFVFTAVVQSSAATLGIVITMASQGLIPLDAGIAVLLGANIGTCATAMLACIGRPREAVRAALAHVLFNVIGVVAWLPFIPQLEAVVTGLTPGSAAREIANAHTLFNVVNVAVMIWFTGPLTRLILWLVPERAPLPGMEDLPRPRYLDSALLETPPAALDAVRLELGNVGARVRRMLVAGLPAAIQGSRPALDAVARMDAGVDVLYESVMDYLRRIGSRTMTRSQATTYLALMEAARGLESIGDLVETDMVTIGRRRLEEKIAISEHSARRVTALHDRVLDALDGTLEAVRSGDVDAARRVVAMKPDIHALVQAATRHGAARLVANEPNRVAAYTREMELIEQLRRIYYFCKRICRALADPEPATEEAAPSLGAAAE
ncbi:Na/Pi cotransporter family protein [Caenispirillum bisanense]|uniref:Phosphate:Na+ symporter n=1 Tax=Caenispirillum bisanense TaxID=414052 RepID=A0A286GQV5_9PROT|nr:Na/Pi cotransporter family protein [Caenispirillum bisanense]SOD97898.1 phosphate:Na+ symporter [Caenispirillum bisanense]